MIEAVERNRNESQCRLVGMNEQELKEIGFADRTIEGEGFGWPMATVPIG